MLDLMFELGAHLARYGWALRSGGADGSDTWFEAGCDSVGGAKEIYLPWAGFNGKTGIVLPDDIPEALKLARTAHPAWQRLSQAAKRLHTRNVYQVLGNDLATPSDFVICWTEGGAGAGGTGQALRLAEVFDIPIFDLGKYSDVAVARSAVFEWIRQFTGEIKTT